MSAAGRASGPAGLRPELQSLNSATWLQLTESIGCVVLSETTSRHVVIFIQPIGHSHTMEQLQP